MTRDLDTIEQARRAKFLIGKAKDRGGEDWPALYARDVAMLLADGGRIRVL